MSVFGDVRADMAAKLTAAGVAGVTLDPAANPPFVLVDLVTLDGPPSGIGVWPGTVAIKLVVPPPGDAKAATALEDTLEAVLRTLGRAPAYPETYTAGPGSAECPSYRLLYPVHVPNPDC